MIFIIPFFNAAIYFVVYSFFGWALESAYGTYVFKKFVNRGFLTGCFCPIYGFGALSIIWLFHMTENLIHNVYAAIAADILLSIFLLTALEYITGYVLEKIFKCKYWDYSNNFLNINGYVCLPYSLLWGLLAFVLIFFVHPYLAMAVSLVPVPLKALSCTAILLYFTADVAKSVVETLNLKNVIINYTNLPINKYKEKILHYKRIFNAFPHLQNLNADIRNFDVRSIVNEKIEQFKDVITNIKP